MTRLPGQAWNIVQSLKHSVSCSYNTSFHNVPDDNDSRTRVRVYELTRKFHLIFAYRSFGIDKEKEDIGLG